MNKNTYFEVEVGLAISFHICKVYSNVIAPINPVRKLLKICINEIVFGIE
jgi:hypothetical protein